MPRTTVDQAYRTLCRITEEQRAAGHDKLPPVRELAGRCGCSLATAVAALRRLALQGCVSPLRRVGTAILSSPVAIGPARASPAAMTLPQRLLDDLLCGRFDSTAGRLPPAKQLMAQYGAGRVRIGRAIRQLQREQWVERDGRSVRRRPPGSSPSTLSLHLLMVGDNRGEVGAFAPHRIPLVRNLEDQCRRAALMLRPHLVARGFGMPTLGAPLVRELTAAARDSSTAGVVVCTMHMGADMWGQVRDLFAARGSRCVLLDDSGTLGQAELDRLPPHWLRFSITHSDLCGYAAGQYLLRLGHRQVAFALGAPLSQEPWPVARLAGLRRAFAAAGLPNGVGLIAPGRRVAPIADPPQLASRLHNALLAGAGVSYVPRADTMAFKLFADEVSGLLGAHRYRHALRLRLAPLLDRLLADRGVSAIVAAGDATAVACLDCLQSRGIPVPQRLSLLSFDNSELALERHISSYDFNTAGVAALIVSSIAEPQGIRRTRGSSVVVELDGFVVERATTRRDHLP